MKYIFSDNAKRDLNEITDHYSQINLHLANQLLDAMDTAIETILSHPEAGHLRPDITHLPLRFWPLIWHYTIVYRNHPPIEILRILSSYRDMNSILTRFYAN